VSLILFFSPITCATSAHIALELSGLGYQSHYIDLSDDRHHQTSYIDKNPKGSVPALELSDGQILTENQAILTYIADLVPEKKLLPEPQTLARARAHEWMNFCAASVHPLVRSVFRPSAYVGSSRVAQIAIRKYGLGNMTTVCGVIENRLNTSGWSLGDSFSVCDAYLYILYLWSRDQRMGNLPDYPKWRELALNVHEQPSTQIVLKRELEFRRGYHFPTGFRIL
jgi:glutathione S-transferase